MTSNRNLKKIALVANWDWVLYNFRLPLARELEKAGLHVVLICPRGKYFDKIKNSGYNIKEWDLDRRSLMPWEEIMAINKLIHLYRSLNLSIVHHFTIKPIVYGSFAARIAGIPKVINNFTGLGYLFSTGLKSTLLRILIVPFLKIVTLGKRYFALFQNEHDRDRLVNLKLSKKKNTSIIPGTGVDLTNFKMIKKKPKNNPLVILMAARLLFDKGVREYVQAAKKIMDSGNLKATFLLAGDSDMGNPAHVPEELLAEWKAQGAVEFLGHRSDINDLLQKVDIAILPSYHEGIPLFLLEAAASGLPIVATDISGCRMVVEDGLNGFLIPPKDAGKLADAIKRLIEDPALRTKMGAHSRQIAVTKFDIRIILDQYLQIYQKLEILNSPSIEMAA